MEDCEAKVPSIERRLERFLSNKRIETENMWKSFLAVIMPHFQKSRYWLSLIDLPVEDVLENIKSALK
ncbi:hypothetical protein [Dictyobacter arantiisoli]|uniref:Uncharacterized protein n=1 Tax=Dictyobacter arantiisoli TaxID=2014874 RepID=A0A5A5THB1_9CHLR|nr:hypothetical protein [Dictyobacter arantiisoli]GCF10960.1 hypothetical protein KDI_45240 [Dictyobacter arantiisoli]